MVRVGLVGFGFAGRVFHAQVISAVEGLELAVIVQRTGDSAAAAYPRVRVVRTVEEMLADASIRAVVVATPNATHFSIARQCLLAGRDVVVDKPFALNAGEAAELVRLAQAQGRLLAVYQNRRWDGDFLTVQRLVAEGRLGRVVMFESRYDRFRLLPRLHLWREDGSAGGGVLFDLGAHLVDQALVLFGVPGRVWASVRRERAGALSDDAFDVCLDYGELTVWLRASCLAWAPGARFTVYGTEGTFRKSGMDPQEGRLLGGVKEFWEPEEPAAWGTFTGAEGSAPVESERGDYRGFYWNVRDAVLGKVGLAVSGAEAWRGLLVLEAAVRSSRDGGWVEGPRQLAPGALG